MANVFPDFFFLKNVPNYFFFEIIFKLVAYFFLFFIFLII